MDGYDDDIDVTDDPYDHATGPFMCCCSINSRVEHGEMSNRLIRNNSAYSQLLAPFP